MLNLDIVLVWMYSLEFEYKTRNKHFYVDSHNKLDVLKYRDGNFVPQYLDQEFRQHRWAQISIADIVQLVADGKIGE